MAKIPNRRGPYYLFIGYTSQPDQDVVIRLATARELESKERALKRFDREADDNHGIHWDSFDSAEWENMPQTRPEVAVQLRRLLAEESGESFQE